MGVLGLSVGDSSLYGSCLSLSCLPRTRPCRSASRVSVRPSLVWRLSCRCPLRLWPRPELTLSSTVAEPGSCRWVGQMGGAGGWKGVVVTAVLLAVTCLLVSGLPDPPGQP